MLLGYHDYESTFTYKLGKKFFLFLLTYLNTPSLLAVKMFLESFLNSNLNSNNIILNNTTYYKDNKLNNKNVYVETNIYTFDNNNYKSTNNFNLVNNNNYNNSSHTDKSANNRLYLRLQANRNSINITFFTVKMLVKQIRLILKNNQKL